LEEFFCEFVGRFGRQRIVFVVEFGGFDRDVGDDGGEWGSSGFVGEAS
jgi:hypothetical protein